MVDVGSRNREKQVVRLFSLNIAIHILAWLILGLVVASGILLALWITFGKPPIQDRSADGIGPAILFNASKLALGVVAGMGGVVALVVATRRQRLGEADHDRQEQATVRDETRLFTERFAQATQQLGSDQAAARVAGVYALAGLADDWPAGRQTCVDVLCAYLRMPFRLRGDVPIYAPSENTPGRRQLASLRESMEESRDGRMAYPAGEEHQVRLTILGAMRQRMNRDSEVRWTDLTLDFTGATFDHANFEGFRFEDCEVNFSRCVFLGNAIFVRCAVVRSRLSFSGCVYTGSIRFTSSRFDNADVNIFGEFVDESSGFVSFGGCVMESGEIKISGPRGRRGRVDFTAAQLEGGGVSITGAQMNEESVISFDKTMISGYVDLVGGTYSGGSVNFTDASINGGLVTFSGSRGGRDPRLALRGTEISFARSTISDGGIGFRFLDVSGSAIRFDTLSMTGGAIQFVDVALNSGSVTMDNAMVSGGVIDLGEIADTESGRAISSKVGEFVHAGPPASWFTLF